MHDVERGKRGEARGGATREAGVARETARAGALERMGRYYISRHAHVRHRYFLTRENIRDTQMIRSRPCIGY